MIGALAVARHAGRPHAAARLGRRNRDQPDQQKINAAVTQALNDPEPVKRLREQGGEPSPMTTAQFRQFLHGESARFARIVESAKITAE